MNTRRVLLDFPFLICALSDFYKWQSSLLLRFYVKLENLFLYNLCVYKFFFSTL